MLSFLRSRAVFVAVVLAVGATAPAGAEPAGKTDAPAETNKAEPAADATKPAAPAAAAATVPDPAKTSNIDPARLAAARKLIELTGADKQLDGVVGKVMALMQQQFERRAPKFKKEIGEVLAPLAEKYAAKKSELLDKVIAHYATTLSAEDLDAVTKFFSDGAGQRYIAAVPALLDGTAAIAKEWGRTLGESIRRDAEPEFKKRKIPM